MFQLCLLCDRRVVQLLSRICFFVSTPVFSVLHCLLELAQTHVHQVSDTIQPSHPLLFLPSIFPSIRVFSNESALHIRQPKYQKFNISPSNEYSCLISFRIDWFAFLAVLGTLKSCHQHPSLKASILWCSAFFMVQLSHPYMTTGKTIALTSWTLSAKYCLCFSIQCLSLSQIFFQGANIFKFPQGISGQRIFEQQGTSRQSTLSEGQEALKDCSREERAPIQKVY